MKNLYDAAGLRLVIKSREHYPLHVHVYFKGHEELIEIESLETYIGSIPSRQRKLIVEWMKINRSYLVEVWWALNPHLGRAKEV